MSFSLPLYRSLGGPQNRSGRLVPTGVEPRFLSRRNTDWAIPDPDPLLIYSERRQEPNERRRPKWGLASWWALSHITGLLDWSVGRTEVVEEQSVPASVCPPRSRVRTTLGLNSSLQRNRRLAKYILARPLGSCYLKWSCNRLRANMNEVFCILQPS
jgi:hypothetical protein